VEKDLRTIDGDPRSSRRDCARRTRTCGASPTCIRGRPPPTSSRAFVMLVCPRSPRRAILPSLVVGGVDLTLLRYLDSFLPGWSRRRGPNRGASIPLCRRPGNPPYHASELPNPRTLRACSRPTLGSCTCWCSRRSATSGPPLLRAHHDRNQRIEDVHVLRSYVLPGRCRPRR